MAKRKAKKAVVSEAPAASDGVLPSSIRVLCPVCQSHWSDATISFGKTVRKEDFVLRPDFTGKVKFQSNGLPCCPICNFKYDDRAMYGLLIAASNGKAIEEGTWNRPGR